VKPKPIEYFVEMMQGVFFRPEKHEQRSHEERESESVAPLGVGLRFRRTAGEVCKRRRPPGAPPPSRAVRPPQREPSCSALERASYVRECRARPILGLAEQPAAGTAPQILYAVRSEPKLCHDFGLSLLFEWLVRSPIADPRWRRSSVAEIADRWLFWISAETLHDQTQAQAERRSLSSREYFSAERTPIVGWRQSRC